MASFLVVRLTKNGFALLESDDGLPIKSRLTLYRGNQPAAVVVDTLASVEKPLYLAEPRVPLLVGAVLESKR
ncbi:hypothetical protein HY572_03220 [Candidatus Micrarchaeota archaeon]|nr:hypothetical protein [Candidatus Micrarchaeota archaeon]